MEDLKAESPLSVYRHYCRQGELAYQVDEIGRPVFYPRVTTPKTGESIRGWKVSVGLGSVYATTVVANRDGSRHNVALIDVDEGFRMMSRVDDIDPMAVRIGMRVKLRMLPEQDQRPAYPVFVPLGEGK